MPTYTQSKIMLCPFEDKRLFVGCYKFLTLRSLCTGVLSNLNVGEEVFELLFLFLIWVIIRKKYSFFSLNYEWGGECNKYVPKHNHTFYWHPPSMMQLKVSHYYGDVILHFTKSGGMNKQDRYLPMRESEFVALLSMVDEINNKENEKNSQKRETAFR